MTVNINEKMELIEAAIKALEEKKQGLMAEMPVFLNEERGEYTVPWLQVTWQINLDIERLIDLEFEYRFNSATMDAKKVRMLEDRLKTKYGIII